MQADLYNGHKIVVGALLLFWGPLAQSRRPENYCDY